MELGPKRILDRSTTKRWQRTLHQTLLDQCSEIDRQHVAGLLAYDRTFTLHPVRSVRSKESQR